MEDVSRFLAALTDPATVVRSEVSVALGFDGPLEASVVPVLAEYLSDKEPIRRAVAAATLVYIGPDAMDAVPALIETLLHDPVPAIRRVAAEALGKIGASAAVPALARVVLNESEFSTVRLEAAFALGRLGLPASALVPRLIRALTDHPDVAVRLEAARLLATLVRPVSAVVSALYKASVEDPDVKVREAARRALERNVPN
jgi:HEAT repeat protein